MARRFRPRARRDVRQPEMMLEMANPVPVIVLALLIVAALPVWRWSRGWGWAPAAMLAMGLATLLLFSWTVLPA